MSPLQSSADSAVRNETIAGVLRRHRSTIAACFWAVTVLGGIAFFFWLIWDPPI